MLLGGHDVPAPTVLRRFERGLHNLFHLYRDLADSWILFDNSGEEPRIIAKQTNRVLKVFDGKLLIEIKKAAWGFMKPRSRMKEEVKNLPLDVRAEMALKEAVADAIAEHKRMGRPIVVWRDGKVVTIPPEKIVVPEK